MTGIPTGWTTESYAAYNEAMREADIRLQAERDLRYKEVAQEREKAIRIKEDADKAALLLARDIQTYKDEKANELREQINRERGLYVTQNDLKALADKFDAAHKPVLEFIAGQTGRGVGSDKTLAIFIGLAGFLATLLAIGSFVFRAQSSTPPQVIYVPAPSGTMLPTTPPQPTTQGR